MCIFLDLTFRSVTWFFDTKLRFTPTSYNDIIFKRTGSKNCLWHPYIWKSYLPWHALKSTLSSLLSPFMFPIVYCTAFIFFILCTQTTTIEQKLSDLTQWKCTTLHCRGSEVWNQGVSRTGPFCRCCQLYPWLAIFNLWKRLHLWPMATSLHHSNFFPLLSHFLLLTSAQLPLKINLFLRRFFLNDEGNSPMSICSIYSQLLNLFYQVRWYRSQGSRHTALGAH